MPLISIITAATTKSADFLAETIECVRAQELPEDWRLEWIVQEDGPTPSLANRLEDLEHVRYEASGTQLGIAATRNLALSRASGDLVQVLDSDDVLLPGALVAMIPHFVGTTIHWAIGQADDLMPDGRRVSWQSALPFGRVPAGSVNQWAREHNANWPVHCAGLMMRTTSLRAIGGWVGTPADEDVAMFAALSELADGYNERTVTWLYRQHPEQISRDNAWRNRSINGRRIALQRANALADAGLSLAMKSTLRYGQAASEIALDLPAKPRPPV